MTFPRDHAIWQLVTDEDTINLFQIGSDGVQATAPDEDGLGSVRLATENYDNPAAGLAELIFTERAGVVIRAATVNAVVREHRRLVAAARKAFQYRKRPARYGAPVYLVEKAFGESQPRYALVHSIPEYEAPHSLWSSAMAQRAALDGLDVTIHRQIWRDGVPGQRGNAKAQQVLDNHPTLSPHDQSFIMNLRQTNGAPTHIFNWTGSFSANLLGTAHTIWRATPASGDIYYIGFPTAEAMLAFAFRVTSPGSDITTVVYEYSNGAGGWPGLTLSTHYSVFPNPWWVRNGLAGFFFNLYNGVTNPALETVNGVNRYWLRVRVTAVGGAPVGPAIAADHAAIRQPSIELPAAETKGDVPPYVLLRLAAPGGNTGTAGGMAAINRAMVGLKTRHLDTFVSHLNLGNQGNPAGWAVGYGTDTSAATAVPLGPTVPGGAYSSVSFATDITMVMRARLTGTNLLESYRGEYRVYLRAFQNGGAAGDVSAKLRALIGAVGATTPAAEFPEVALRVGYPELINLTPGGYLKLPLADVDAVDPTQTGDVSLEIQARRAAGSAATMILFDLILLPVDEWSVEWDDPLSNTSAGASALRGGSILEDDGGVIRDRTIKKQATAWVGGVELIAETWNRKGLPLRLEPGKRGRLYFILGSYPAAGWGQPPLLAPFPLAAHVQWFAHNCYQYMRGDD